MPEIELLRAFPRENAVYVDTWLLFFSLCLRSIIILSSVAQRRASSQQSSAVWCRACRAVRYCAMLCRAVPCCVLCCNNSFVHARSHSTKYHPAVPRYNTTSGLYAPGTALLNHIICSQLSSAKAQQRAAQRSAAPFGAVRFGAVRCLALPCGAVLCGTVRCCAVLRAVLYLILRACQVSFDEVSCSSTAAHHTRFVRTTLLNNKKLHC